MNAPLAKEQIALLMSASLTYRMPAVQGTEGILPEARPSAWSLLVRRVAGAVQATLEFPRRRAVLDELSRLTDRELADIGLNRADLKRVFQPQFRRHQP